MRLSKKLLATLLPMAATASVAPVLASCNKGPGYDIAAFFDLNCLLEKGKDYRTLDSVKIVVKNHADKYQKSTITLAQLNKASWENTDDLGKQALYYDLIASYSIVAKTKFYLVWPTTSEEPNISLTLDGKDAAKTLPTSLSYRLVDNKIHIVFNSELTTESYRFQNVEIKE